MNCVKRELLTSEHSGSVATQHKRIWLFWFGLLNISSVSILVSFFMCLDFNELFNKFIVFLETKCLVLNKKKRKIKACVGVVLYKNHLFNKLTFIHNYTQKGVFFM